MREILFRGKREDNGEWIEGYFLQLHRSERAFIIPKQFVQRGTLRMSGETPPKIIPIEVIPETVGQYSGLVDKDRKKIFEGDIVRYETIAHNGYEGIYKVVFEDRNGCGYFGIAYSDIETCVFCYSTPASQMDIIGNIYDNPELFGE